MELLKLKAKFEAFETGRFYSVVVQHQGTAPDAEFRQLPAFKSPLPTSDNDWNWIGESYGFPISAIAAYGDEAPEKAKIYRRFYFLSNMPKELFGAIEQAGKLIGEWASYSRVPRCTLDFPIPAGVWMGVLYDKFTDPTIAPELWIPGRSFKLSKEVHGDHATIPNIASYSLMAIDTLAGKRWNGRSVYRAPVAEMLADPGDELNDRLAVLHYLVLELQKAWPSPMIHGIDAPQLEIDLVWELLSTVPVIESSPLPNLRFPSQEDLSYWDRSEETEQRIRDAFAIYHEALDRVLLSLLAYKARIGQVDERGINLREPQEESTLQIPIESPIASSDVVEGTSIDKETLQERELLKQHWFQFKENYKDHGYSRASFPNFVAWRSEFLNIKTHEASDARSELEAHRKWENRHKKAGR
ncbi:hypothetical protein AB1K70_20215 [Bremerella sp. JC770]|uniref:hypothetical protein n=1 Tax=Bremerella sp. JC770 TaxID=3232137 RepID=UPI003459C80E